jgi:hypothetical protein
MKTLTPHPRLYISAAHYAGLAEAAGASPRLELAQQQLTELARSAMEDDSVEIDAGEHNWHLLRARLTQKRTVSLLTEYKRTGERAFRERIIHYVRQMAEWEYWSWIAWRNGDARPEAIFDLSYGENAFTLALLFDALAPELNAAELKLFVDTARNRALLPYLANNGGEKRAWYYQHPHSNWNTVCNGGAGMLALAMAEHIPESAQVVDLVNAGVDPFFRGMGADGAWPEGIGYWNYGMRYGLCYLLSHERATGSPHPLLALSAVAATLRFPLSFSPRGIACSFGDVNRFAPLPFMYAIAERLGRWDVIREVDARMANPPEKTTWPDAAELLLLHPRQRIPAGISENEWPRHALMQGLDWGYVADAMPNPSIYAAIRGGTTKVPHAHIDLMSFSYMVQDEVLIENIGVENYCDSTFGERRFELYETSYASKNTILINGIGIEKDSAVQTQAVTVADAQGFRIDATEAFGKAHRGTGPLFAGRLLLLLRGKALLVIDQVKLPFAGWVESRLHTHAQTAVDQQRVKLTGKRQSATIVIAASQALFIKTGQGIPSAPKTPADTLIRIMADDKVDASTIACLFTPGGVDSSLLIKETESELIVSGSIPESFELRIKAGLIVE